MIRADGLLIASANDDGRIGIPPNPSIIEGSWQMTPSEMEEQIKNFNQWASEVAEYLPLLATKEDLKAFATKEDLKATREELKAGLEDAKRYTENLILVTRREIRQVDEKVTAIAADVRQIVHQVVILTAPKRKK
jgi:hypothetical protein